MDKTALVQLVSHLFSISGYKTQTSVKINHREIDVVAEETQGLIRKTVLIECADYSGSVGIDKMTTDIQKLETAREKLGYRAILMHVSRNGYSPEAQGYALDRGIDLFTLGELTNRLINFGDYIDAVEKDASRSVIMREYQPTTIHFEGDNDDQRRAIEFLDLWLETDARWLTVLGDYGVGKSWMLKRYLYHLIDKYREDPTHSPLPFFVPLQHFTKAFDYKNLILATFQRYGLGGVHYSAFEYLANSGRVVFLFDSFDEMAQVLRPDTIRENLKELLAGVVHKSRAIMTSRPTYFESRAERLLLVEEQGELTWHQLDREKKAHTTALSRFLSERLETSRFARLNDLSVPQRMALFRAVLGDKPRAHSRLSQLFKRFQSLETISQRAVIARLLTTVAETLADDAALVTIEGRHLLPEDLEQLNEAKIFEIVVYNLLQRDVNIGLLNASDRLRFLRAFAVYLQRRSGYFFAQPSEVKSLVESLFAQHLRTTDTPVQLLENFYRACRRHSGLTTEGQFLDTSGNIDSPVDERDTESRVGFSHNSLREYLVADAIADHLINGSQYTHLYDVVITETIGGFLHDMISYTPEIEVSVAEIYRSCADSIARDWLFQIIYQLLRRSPTRMVRMLGSPPTVSGSDLCNRDLSGLSLRDALIEDCIAGDSDFRKSDLRGCNFRRTIIDRAMFDGAYLAGADFTDAELVSVFVYDSFDRKTSAVLTGRDARQWLHSHGAHVKGMEELNPYLGQPWYEAAREVTRTLQHRIAGTHQDVSLIKGIDPAYRELAWEFVHFLVRANIIRRVRKTDPGRPGDWLVKVNQSHYKTVTNFSERGIVDSILKPFLDKYVSGKQRDKQRK